VGYRIRIMRMIIAYWIMPKTHRQTMMIGLRMGGVIMFANEIMKNKVE